MTQLFANNAVTTLNGAITAGATSITVTDGGVFPSPSGGDYFLATLSDGSNIEIVKCTARSGNVLTVVRGQEGTTGFAFADLDAIELRVTKESLENLLQKNIEENAQTGTTYTLALDDALKLVSMTNAASNTLTVPPNASVAFDIGTQIMVEWGGAGQTAIAQGSGVTINKASTLLLRAQYSCVLLIKTATDTWLLVGDTE